MTTLMIDAGPVDPTAPVTRTGGVPLAPAGTAWPRCAACDGPMKFLAQVFLDGGAVLAVFACQNSPGACADWAPDAGGNRALLFPAVGLEALPRPADEVDEDVLLLGAVRAVEQVVVDEPDYDDAREGWAAGSGRPVKTVLGGLGGAPAWLQYDETPDCPSCAVPMPLVVQLEEGPQAVTAMNFGSGRAYAFGCEPCGRAAFLWQC